MENKEDTYISLLTKKLEEYGYTICPTMYQPFVPEAAAESNAEAAAAAEAAVSDAYARADDAQQWYEEARGGPGEAGAAARLKEAEAAVAAAEKLVSEIRDAGVAAERAAVASVPLLEQYDVVFWKPRKKMMVSYDLHRKLTVQQCITQAEPWPAHTLSFLCVVQTQNSRLASACVAQHRCYLHVGCAGRL